MFLILVPALCIYLAAQVVNGGVSAVATSWNTISSAISTLVIPVLAWLAVGLVVFAGFYSALHLLTSVGTDGFIRVYDAAHSSPNPAQALKEQLNLPTAKPSYALMYGILDRGRKTIARQQIVIYVLVVGMGIGLLTCYLSLDTFTEARRLLQEAVQLGGVNIAVFAVLAYSAKQIMDLDGVFRSGSRFAWGVTLSLIFGIATVITLVVVPLVLQETNFTGSTIGVALIVNLVADGLILLLEKGAVRLTLEEAIGKFQMLVAAPIERFRSIFIETIHMVILMIIPVTGENEKTCERL